MQLDAIDKNKYLAEHDDVIKWQHFPRNWPFVRGIHRSPVNSPHKGQWRGALMFSLICVWINDWVNSREAGDLRRYRAHFDVIYIIITKNIRYLLWNRGFWRSLNNTYQIFLTPCIRCTNRLCDSWGLIDVNPHFIPSLLPKIQNGRQQLWRHNDRLFPRCFYERFLNTMMLRTVI